MMHRVRRAPFLAILLGSAIAACGPRAESPGPAAPSAELPAGGKAVEPGAPSVPWREKTLAQRVEFMGLVFFPRMKALFDGEGPEASEQTSADEAAPLRCQTCHGENMIDVRYAMPNGLFPLPEASPHEAALARDEKTARFMMERVVPEARELLGADDAFGCHACHAKGEIGGSSTLR